MRSTLGRHIVVSSCALVLGLSAPLVVGSGARASGPVVPQATPTTSTSYAPSGSEFSLTISPTRLVLGPADLGKTASVLLVNRGSNPVSVTVGKQNFTGGSDGSLAFQPQAPYSASSWVSVSPTAFTIAPGASQQVEAVVTAPASPEPGDHQVALVFLVPAGTTTANVRINRGVAAPVYITVPGPTDDSVVLRDLRAPRFMMWGTADITATVQSTGTVHRDFRGASSLTVTGAGRAAAFPDFTVVRGAARDVSTTWAPPVMCVCHPTVSVVNADGVVRSSTVQVVVLPVHLIAIAVLLGFALWFGIRTQRRRAAAPVVPAPSPPAPAPPPPAIRS